MYNCAGTKCFGLNEASLPLSSGSKTRKLANQCTTPDRYMQAFRDGLSVTAERLKIQSKHDMLL